MAKNDCFLLYTGDMVLLDGAFVITKELEEAISYNANEGTISWVNLRLMDANVFVLRGTNGSKGPLVWLFPLPVG